MHPKKHLLEQQVLLFSFLPFVTSQHLENSTYFMHISVFFAIHSCVFSEI